MENKPNNLKKETNHTDKKFSTNWIVIALFFMILLIIGIKSIFLISNTEIKTTIILIFLFVILIAIATVISRVYLNSKKIITSLFIILLGSGIPLLLLINNNTIKKTVALIFLFVILIMLIAMTSLDYLNNKKTSSFLQKRKIITIIEKIFLTEQAPLIPCLFNAEDPSDTIGSTIRRMITEGTQSKSSIQELNLINLLKSYKTRFEKEIDNLNRKGNYNLTIGLAATMIGGSCLIYTMFYPPTINQDRWIYITQFTTRFAIVIFFEFFAFFFLRLYKNIQEDIKVYQNEISNIELKTFAAMTALASNDTSLLKPIIEQLAATERNFVLKKGETTIGLERGKLDKNEIIDLVRETLISIQPKCKK